MLANSGLQFRVVCGVLLLVVFPYKLCVIFR